MAMPAQYQLVVSKYKEDVSWIRFIGPKWTILVYSKDPFENDDTFIKLPNLGREAHTYLHHILNFYDDLADITVFVQGNPFDHAPAFLKDLEHIPDDVLYKPFSTQEILMDEFGNPHLTGNSPTSYNMYFKEFYEHILQRPCPILMYCIANALFAVSRDQIRMQSRAFYEKCMQTITCLETPTSTRVDQNIMEAHFFERMWHAIFYPGGSLPVPKEKMALLESLLSQYKEARSTGSTQQASEILRAMNEKLSLGNR